MANADPKDLEIIDRTGLRIRAAQERIGDVPWYPYDSLASLREAAEIAASGGTSLAALAREASVLELGAGDGHGAFVAEALGARHVTTVDWPSSNFNQMTGVCRLAAELGSRADIRVEDVDRGFEFPSHRFNLCLALGILYHLKNPFAFLENIRRCSWHLLLSTAVVLPAGQGPLPAAFLVGETDENADPTNFWLLTPQCLERLLQRTGWEILASRIAPEAGARAAFSGGRMFVLAKARTLDPLAGLDAPFGWHELEENRYRWTERRFGFHIAVPSNRHGVGVRLQVLWPEVSLARFGSLEIRMFLQGRECGRRDVSGSAPCWLEFEAPLPDPCPPYLEVAFELNNALPAEESDPRERGVAADSVSVDWL